MSTCTGSCQCGAVRYTADLDLTKPVMECNCSICSKKGLLLSVSPSEGFTLLSGEDDLIDYKFYKHKILHQFCKVCGVQCFCSGKDGNGDEVKVVNVRTIEDIDLSSLTRMPMDGKSL